MIVGAVSWIVILLSIFCLSFSHETRLDLRLGHRETRALASRALARSGVEFVESLLRETAGNPWDAPIQGWDCNPGLKDVPLGDGHFSLGHASEPGVPATTIYGIEDEERRIPYLCLDREIVTRIPGVTESGVEAVLAARDTVGSNLGAELAFPPDLDAASRVALSQYVTAYGNQGVNVNTASREVLVALGIPPTATEKIIEQRDGPDHLLGTSDDRPFTSLSQGARELAKCELNAEDAASISYLARRGALTTRSNHFRVRSRGWVEGSKDYYEIETVLRRTSDGRLQVIEWKETWAP